VEKLVDTIIENTIPDESVIYPTTFTPVTITRETKILKYDLKLFWDYVQELSA
jgi:hypothetical protein